MSILELRRVEARYGEIRALHDVSITIDDGDFVAILGANGAGKTTTLRAVSGTVKTSGDVLLDGSKIFRRTPESMARRGVAHVPEGRGTFTTLSVLDNLRLGAWVQRGVSPRDLARVFEFFPRLYERREQQAGTLSGGEQQMLALGRAMMAKPRVLLLDEPSLGLAPLMVREIFGALQQMNEGGMTIVVVEQNATLALRAAKHAYVLETGRVVLGGVAADLQANESVPEVLPWLLAAPVANFIQQVVSGLASGGIYGSLALALVLIHRSTGVAQLRAGRARDVVGLHLLVAAGPRLVVLARVRRDARALVRRRRADPAGADPADPGRPACSAIVILTIGLLIAVNGLMTWIWGGAAKQFDGPFSTAPITVGGVAFSKQDIGVIVISLVSVLLIWLLFARTKLGLGLRAAAVNPAEARLDGRARRR